MFENNPPQRGVALYLALMVMTMLLAIALGINSIFLGQTQTIRVMGHSVLAFYAADAGIEAILMTRNDPPLGAGQVVVLSNGATYQVFVTQRGVGGCLALYYCITSIGTYKETKRAVEITY
mgnify:CR=1 FL=1